MTCTDSDDAKSTALHDYWTKYTYVRRCVRDNYRSAV